MKHKNVGKLFSKRTKCENGCYLSKYTEDYRFPDVDAVLIGDYISPFWLRLSPDGCKLHLQHCVKTKSLMSTNAEKGVMHAMDDI
jgi:hypothetical protein